MKRHWLTLAIALAVFIQAIIYLLVLKTLRQNAAATRESQKAFIVAQVYGSTDFNPLHEQALEMSLQLSSTVGSIRDASLLKPPDGAKVAIVEFENLECPWDARAHPIVQSAASSNHIPLLRRDLPITSYLPWSFDAAVSARYLQDKVSPALAEAFRTDVFANQSQIASREDLDSFTRSWFRSHNLPLPAALDSSRNEVTTDRALADRIGVDHTPSIFVVTQTRQIPLTDVKQLDQAIHSGSRPN